MPRRQHQTRAGKDVMSMNTLDATTAKRVPLSEELLPYARMAQIAESKKEGYAAGKPFPHIVIDDFFDPAVLDRVLASFRTRTTRIGKRTIFRRKSSCSRRASARFPAIPGSCSTR